jgi:hypothetical protein
LNLSHASGHAEAEALRLDDTRTRHGARNGLRWARSDRHQLAVFAERQARDLVTAPKYGGGSGGPKSRAQIVPLSNWTVMPSGE